MQAIPKKELICCVCGNAILRSEIKWGKLVHPSERYFIIRGSQFWCDSSCYMKWCVTKVRKLIEEIWEIDTQTAMNPFWDILEFDLTWMAFKKSAVKHRQRCEVCGVFYKTGYLYRRLARKRGVGWYQPHDRWCRKSCYEYHKEFSKSARQLSSKFRHWKTVPAALVETNMITNRIRKLCQK